MLAHSVDTKWRDRRALRPLRSRRLVQAPLLPGAVKEAENNSGNQAKGVYYQRQEGKGINAHTQAPIVQLFDLIFEFPPGQAAERAHNVGERAWPWYNGFDG
jgi:hypothetical protein